MKYNFVIPGNPVPYAAPRCNRRVFYDVRHKEKDDARHSIRSQFSGSIIHGPVKLRFAFYMPIPKSASKSAKVSMASGLIPHTTKPDVSNLLKLYEDILKDIVIIDDACVVDLKGSKVYSEDPRIEVTVIY